MFPYSHHKQVFYMLNLQIIKNRVLKHNIEFHNKNPKWFVLELIVRLGGLHWLKTAYIKRVFSKFVAIFHTFLTFFCNCSCLQNSWTHSITYISCCDGYTKKLYSIFYGQTRNQSLKKVGFVRFQLRLNEATYAPIL